MVIRYNIKDKNHNCIDLGNDPLDFDLDTHAEGNYYPFETRLHALLYMLTNGPCPMVR